MGIFSNIKEKIIRYIEVNIKLFKIDFIGRTANLMGFFMFALMGLFILSCIILFIGFGITEGFIAMGIPRVGAFFMTTGIYCVLLITVVLLRKPIVRFFESSFIDVLTGDDKVDSENEDKPKT